MWYMHQPTTLHCACSRWWNAVITLHSTGRVMFMFSEQHLSPFATRVLSSPIRSTAVCYSTMPELHKTRICICLARLPQSVQVVWQKRNETDFLLTMNFILFKNQGYHLQNSSLGQIHSDGGVVSIVRSSSGRLLLVYLLARLLRSSGYSPK